MNKSLKAIRNEKKLSQTQLAEIAHISQPGYANIENHKRKPSVETAKRVASVLGISWTTLFEEGERERP